MEDTYNDEFGKVALALTSAQIAKSTFISEGSSDRDLAFNFLGWKEGRLIVVTQLNIHYMKEDPITRLSRCTDMCRTLKAHWDIDAISMIAEGYCSSDTAKTRGLDLAKIFREGMREVAECLTVTHVESAPPKDDGGPMLTLVSMPYSYKSTNAVKFDRVSVYPQGAMNVLRDKSYPAMLYKTINESYYIEETDTTDVIERLMKIGFHVQIVH